MKNSLTTFKTSLVNLTNNLTPELTLAINYGSIGIKGKLYSFQLDNHYLGDFKTTVPKYHCPINIDMSIIPHNIFIFSGSLVTFSIHNGRTYIVLRQSLHHGKSMERYIDLKFVVDEEYELSQHIGKPSLVLGYLFPTPLGKKNLTICGCGEIFKISGETIHNILDTTL